MGELNTADCFGTSFSTDFSFKNKSPSCIFFSVKSGMTCVATLTFALQDDGVNLV